MSAENPRGKGSADGSTDAEVKDSLVPCPTCGERFKGESGVKIHHNKIHGESIAGVEVDCDWCGDKLVRKPYRLEKFDNQFCDKNCKAEYMDEHTEGENGPRWKGGKVDRECEICGETFRTRPTRDTRFCSRKCHGKFTSKNQSGEDHPNWNGGKTNYYGPNWKKQRRKARKRDQYCCQVCGRDERDLGRIPSCHHITKLRYFQEKYDEPEWYQRGNRLDNLMLLCEQHHKEWEGIPLRPQ